MNVTIVDPWADGDEVKHEYEIDSFKQIPNNKFDTIIYAVAHKEFEHINMSQYLSENSVVFDVKGTMSTTLADGSL